MTSQHPPPLQRYGAALGRLRWILQRGALARADALAQAHACGVLAREAGIAVTLLVESMSGVIPEPAYEDRSLPCELVTAAAEAWLDVEGVEQGAGVAR